MMSKNGIGLAILALSLLGIEVTDVQIIEVVSSAGTIISFALMIWNQAQRSDVVGFFFKK